MSVLVFSHWSFARAMCPNMLPRGSGSGSTNIGTCVAIGPSGPTVTRVPKRIAPIASWMMAIRFSRLCGGTYISVLFRSDGLEPREHVVSLGQREDRSCGSVARENADVEQRFTRRFPPVWQFEGRSTRVKALRGEHFTLPHGQAADMGYRFCKGFPRM